MTNRCKRPGRALRCRAHKWGRVLTTPAPWRPAQSDPGRTRGQGYRGGDPRKAAARCALTHAGRLTKKEHYLLMANQNPTDDGPAVALTISADQARILRPLLEMVRDGVRDELANYPDRLREPQRLRREEDVYGRLLAALDGSSVIPDPELVAVLAELATVIDASNEYCRVVAEHDALHGLLARVGGCQGEQS